MCDDSCSGGGERTRTTGVPADQTGIAYYQALRREGTAVYRATPYSRGQSPVAFNFDWSFDYYPRAYRRPGPQTVVYRLHGGRCAG